jgi:hypothetical protein
MGCNKTGVLKQYPEGGWIFRLKELNTPVRETNSGCKSVSEDGLFSGQHKGINSSGVPDLMLR